MDTTSKTFYELSKEYSLKIADPKDLGIYYSIYYNLAFNGFFKEYGYEVYNGDKCYWIYQNCSKVGGVIISPNQLNNLFFIPPFNDALRVVKLVKKLLISNSDGTKDIVVRNVLPHQVDLFSMAGFWSGPNRSRWMQRPTEEFDVIWDRDFRIETPEVMSGKLANEIQIAELFFLMCLT